MTPVAKKYLRGELVEIDAGISAPSIGWHPGDTSVLGICIRYRELTLCNQLGTAAEKKHGGYDIYIDGQEFWYPETAVTRA